MKQLSATYGRRYHNNATVTRLDDLEDRQWTFYIELTIQK